MKSSSLDSPLLPKHSSDNGQDLNSSSTPWVYSILSSGFYRGAIKVCQYMACVSLAVTLFAQKFPYHGVLKYVDEVIYGTGVLAPIILFFTPMHWGFNHRLHRDGAFNTAIWNDPSQKKAFILEGITTLLNVAILIVNLVFGHFISKRTPDEVTEINAEYIIEVISHTYFVCLYLVMFSSWSKMKISILDNREDALKACTHDEDLVSIWTDIVKESQEKKGTQISQSQAVSVWLRLTFKFPIASLLAWAGVIIYTSMQPLQGIIVGVLSDRLNNAPVDASFWYLFEFGVYLTLTFIGQAIFLWMSKLGFARFSAKVEHYLRVGMIKSICTAPDSVAAKVGKGDLSSRYSREIAAIVNFIDKNKLWTSVFFLITSIITLFTLDWRIGYFFTFAVPVLVKMLSEKPGEAHKAATVAAGRLQTSFENVVDLRRITNLFGTGDFVFDKSEAIMEDSMKPIYISKYAGANYVSQVHASGVAYVALMALTVILVIVPRIQAGESDAVKDVISGLFILINLKSPFSQIGQGVEHWLSTSPSLVRVYECCQDDSTKQVQTDDIEQPRQQADLESLLLNEELSFDGVRFRYSADGPDVLKGVSTSLKLGEYTSIIGGSGGGKSTMLNIMTREIIETGGDVKVDGTKLESNTQSDVKRYREQIGIVPQHSVFLNGTIADNIRIGRPNASDVEVLRAARLAQCNFLDTLPNGLQTTLGSGTNLSGGQGQRVCLARALVRNPKLLILDEATSALDPTTEEDAVKTFVDLAKSGVAVVSVTHRLSTTDPCDKVIVLKDGQVAEEGSPQELLQKQDGLFREMRKSP